METSGEFVRKTTQLDNDVQDIWERLDQVVGTQTAHTSRFDRVESQLTSIGAIVRRHDTRFAEIGRDLDAIKMQQVLHGDQLARQADKLAHHDIQLQRHGVILDEHSVKLDDLTSRLGHVAAHVEAVAAQVDTVADQVGQLLTFFGIGPGSDPGRPRP